MTVQTIQPAVLAPALPAVVDLPASLPAEMAAIVQWANTAEAARRLVEAIVDTPFMPQAFWPKADPRDREAVAHAREVAIASGTAAVLYGGPLGLNPMQSLANIHVVKGKPGLPAELMVALVRSHGHEVGVDDLTDSRCVVWGKRSGSEQVHRATFTIDRARKAGYVSQNAKYNSDPQSMLYARAMSILCRQMAPEVLKGLPTSEELTDEPDGTAAAPATRTVKSPRARAIAAAPAALQAPAQPAPRPVPAEGDDLLGYDQPTAAPASAAAPESLAEGQWRAINEAFNTLGVKGPGQGNARLFVIGKMIGREIGKGSELTADEATTVLDTLSANGIEIVHQHVGNAGFPLLALPEPAPTAVQQDDADELLGDDDFDPTAQDDWQLMDGGEVAGDELLG